MPRAERPEVLWDYRGCQNNAATGMPGGLSPGYGNETPPGLRGVETGRGGNHRAQSRRDFVGVARDFSPGRASPVSASTTQSPSTGAGVDDARTISADAISPGPPSARNPHYSHPSPSAIGSRTVKVLPTPGTLSTVMLPPCISVSRRAIASPSPVPP